MTGYGMEFGGSAPAKMHQGMVSCNVLKEYVRNYPCLREVALLLKRFLSVNNLNNAYLGKSRFFFIFKFRRDKLI